LCGLGFSQEYEIWGVWNLGTKENSYIWQTRNDGWYLYTWDKLALIFDSGDHQGSEPEILEEGYTYIIKEIIYDENDKTRVVFYIETRDSRKMRAKLIMHFIDQNHMWIEIDRTDKQYPTDLEFETYAFPGQKVVFWREKVVK
jgi:hypothetical protein